MTMIHLLLIPADSKVIRFVDAASGIVTIDPATGNGATLRTFSVACWQDADAATDADGKVVAKKVDAASSAWSRLRGMAATKCANANVRAAFDAARGLKDDDGNVVRYPDAFASAKLRALGKHAREAVAAGRPVGFRMLDGTVAMIGATLPDAEATQNLLAAPAKASRRTAARNYVKAVQASAPLALPAPAE
jgi:hypothetical protein